MAKKDFEEIFMKGTLKKKKPAVKGKAEPEEKEEAEAGEGEAKGKKCSKCGCEM